MPGKALRVSYLVIHLPAILAVPALRQFLVLFEWLTLLDQQFSGLGGHNRVWRNRFEHQRHCPYPAAPPYSNRPQDRSSHTDSDIIFDSWVTLLQTSRAAPPPTCSPQGDLVVEHNIVTNHCRFTYDHTRSVIDEETLADLRSRVNLDPAGHQPRKLRNKSWYKRYMRLIESMRDAVIDDSPQALVEQCLKDIATGGVLLEYHVDSIRPARLAMRVAAGRGNEHTGRQLRQLCQIVFTVMNQFLVTRFIWDAM